MTTRKQCYTYELTRFVTADTKSARATKTKKKSLMDWGVVYEMNEKLLTIGSC